MAFDPPNAKKEAEESRRVEVASSALSRN